MKFILGDELPWTASISPSLKKWIDNFQPDLIYTLPGGPYMALSERVADQYNIPIAMHMMDDWPATLSAKGLFGFLSKHQAKKDLKSLIKKSKLHLVISDAMAKAYNDRYGASFQAFQNAVDTASRLSQSRSTWENSKKFTLVYIGSIHPNAQLQSLIDVAETVQSLNEEGHAIEMKIYSPWSDAYRSQLEKKPAVEALNPLDEESIFPALTQADLLLIPVNFDAKSIRYIQYSMPAKIPLYLTSGTPILVYGPREAASVQYALDENWAEVVSQKDKDQLKSVISTLMKRPDVREELATTAKELAQTNHDVKVVRKSFHQSLMSLVHDK